MACFTTQHVLDGADILFVCRDMEDGAWQFHTGLQVAEADARIVSLQSMLTCDDSIAQLRDLPLGWVATRTSSDDVWSWRLAKS